MRPHLLPRSEWPSHGTEAPALKYMYFVPFETILVENPVRETLGSKITKTVSKPRQDR